MRKFMLLTLSLAACNRWEDYLDSAYGPTTYIDSHGFDMRVNGFPVDRPVLDQYLEDRLVEWQSVFNRVGVNCDIRSRLILHISWQPMPFYDYRFPNFALAGLTIPADAGFVLEVGYDPNLTQTAMGFELGHSILWICGQDYSDQGVIDWHNNTGVTI